MAVTATVSNGKAGNRRDTALDFVKGFLVLLMVLYHWLNYYVGPAWDGYRYLRFLTPSFIVITGVMVSHVYLARYSPDSPVLRSRLVERGCKLLLLFAALNVAETLMSTGPQGVAAAWPWARIVAVLTTGGEAAFSILVPIAYFLILAPFVLTAAMRLGVSLAAVAAAAVVAAAAASALGWPNAHLEMLAIAFIGLAGGTRLETLAGRVLPLGALYVAYLVAITLLNVPFMIQVVGVVLSVLLLYAAGRALPERGPLMPAILELGAYSLYAYVAQIAILQVLRRVLRPEALSTVGALVPLALACAATFAAVRLAAILRQRSPLVARAYRAVFA